MDGDTLIAFSTELLEGVSLPEATIEFLLNAGLPDSAAPFLDFFGHGSRRLQPASEAYPIGSEFDRYLCIGTNDAGDPICLDTAFGGAVVLLSHDDNFRAVAVNSSVGQLAESLLAFRKLVDATCERNGEDAFLDGDIPDDLIETLAAELTSIDPECMSDGSFWQTEVTSLRQTSG